MKNKKISFWSILGNAYLFQLRHKWAHHELNWFDKLILKKIYHVAYRDWETVK